MADTRIHRGPHPEDAKWFASDAVGLLRRAAEDLSWLLTRGYAPTAALKLVGDHHLLATRQRIAVMRCSCSDQALLVRQKDEVLPHEAYGRRLVLDGYNVLTTVEAALAKGVLLIGRDGCMRDMASMHGSWRKVIETGPAIEYIGTTLEMLKIQETHWLLDEPVSNSGRLRQAILKLASERGWRWSVDLAPSPDKLLRESQELVATADSGILDICSHWINLARYIVREHAPLAWIVDLSQSESGHVQTRPQ